MTISVVLYPPGYKQTRLDASAIDRIVAAFEQSGRRQTRAPTDLDRKKLADDLFGAWIYYEQGKFGNPGSKDRNGAKKRLDDIINAATELNRLLEPPEGHTAEDCVTRSALFSSAYCGDKPNKPRHLLEFRKPLQEIKEVADYIFKMLSGKPTFRTLSPLQDFLGDWLPDIYFEHFKKKPGGGRLNKDGIPASPYVRFALAVGEEFGETFKVDTINDYLKHWKSRRKK